MSSTKQTSGSFHQKVICKIQKLQILVEPKLYLNVHTMVHYKTSFLWIRNPRWPITIVKYIVKHTQNSAVNVSYLKPVNHTFLAVMCLGCYHKGSFCIYRKSKMTTTAGYCLRGCCWKLSTNLYSQWLLPYIYNYLIEPKLIMIDHWIVLYKVLLFCIYSKLKMYFC